MNRLRKLLIYLNDTIHLHNVSFLKPVGYALLNNSHSRLALSQVEREEISREITTQSSMRTIAVLLGRSLSTISREIKRNGGYALGLG